VEFEGFEDGGVKILESRIQNPETRDQRPEIRDQRSEIRDQRSEARGQRRRLKTGGDSGELRFLFGPE
jgi:hypothetical protein